jgi:hypothetical protein
VTLQVGQAVKAPWGLGHIEGRILEIYGPPGHLQALVSLPIRGSTGEALEQTMVSFPLDSLESVRAAS